MNFLGAVLAELFPRSKRTHTQLATVALLLLFTGVLGTTTVAVASSPACEQIVRSYTDRLIRNVVSPATLRRWREWGIKHPGWHPSLNATARPKFKKVHELHIGKMQLACPILTGDIDLLPAALDNFLLPAAPPAFEQALNTPAVSAPIQAFQAPLGGSPAAVFAGPGGGGGAAGGPGGPVSGGTTPTGTPISVPVPITPVTDAPVPEPGSIVLTLTGLAAIAGFTLVRRRQTVAVA